MARPHYLNRNGYTVVVTPHYQEQWMEARYGTGTQTMAEAGASFDSVSSNFDIFFEAARAAGVTCGTEYTAFGAIVYYRGIFNQRRNRWELELISITPNNQLQTRGRNANGHNHQNTKSIPLP